MRLLYKVVMYLMLLVLFGVLCISLFLGLEALIGWGIGLVGVGDKMDAIQPLVSQIPLILVIATILICIGIVVLALYKQNVVIHYIRKFLYHWGQAFKNLFVSCSKFELLAVLIIPFGASLYFGNVIAVSYDEAITYNFFTSKPFYYCMIFYPYPNNHVLHSLLTNITEYIPFVSVLFGMRIPAILVFMLTWLIGYSFLKKYYSSRVAILVVGFASVMYMSIFYGFMSRGYAFTTLAFVVCMYAAFNIIFKGSRTKDWMFFVVAGVLGCYAIPSFLYAFAILNFLILVYNYKNIKQQIIANIIAGIAVLLLYSPIMIVDGIAALTSNQFVYNVERMDILKGIFFFYRAMFADIAGVPYYVVLLIFIPFALTLYQKDKWHLSLWAIFMLAPFVLLILHAVNPFYRTFLYYNFVLMFLMVVPFKKYLEKISKWCIILFIICLQIAGVYNFDSKVRIEEGFNTDAAEVSETYFTDDNIIVFPCIASANYEFEAKVRGLEDNIHFLNNVNANVDTISNYDFVILEIDRDKTINKKPFRSTGHQNIYKREK